MTALLRPAFRLFHSLLFGGPRLPQAKPTMKPRLESLEARTLLSATASVAPDFQATPLATAASAPYTPAQVRDAYGFNRLPYDGSRQTIAVVDAFDDPKILADLRTFDRTFNLPDPPSFTKATPQGRPAVNGDWAGEIALDVEWAHAIAPKARILLVEATSASDVALMSAVNYARHQPGVAAVSMSWGGAEFSSEAAYDSTFTTPSGHGGVVFVTSSGDNGAGAEWPAVSPNVLAVGGTSLTVTTANAWGGETAWSGSGGGRSHYEGEPAYQRRAQTSGKRTTPDVAYNANPNTGVYVYDSVPDSSGDTGWFAYGGTSAGAPQWAALIALADQGRAEAGRGALTNAGSILYGLSANDFHDIAGGGNGFRAAAGYDMVTGRGSPRADLVIGDLVKYGATSTPTVKPKAAATTAPSHTTASLAEALAVWDRAEAAIEALLRHYHASAG